MSIVEPITAAGGVVFKENEQRPFVLLIFRKSVWDLPKGKREEYESVAECAVREVAEEVGLSQEPEIIFALPETYHEYEQRGTHWGKTTHWFAMRSAEEAKFSPQIDEGIEKVNWFPLDEAKSLVGYTNLEDVLNAFDRIYQKHSH